MSTTIELTVNGEPHSFVSGRCLSDLLEQLEVNSKQVAVEVNRQLIPRESHATCPLESGDTIEVVSLVGGG